MNFEDEPPHNYCNECDVQFEDSFQLIDHVLEDDDEFDPYLVLPNGVKLHQLPVLGGQHARGQRQRIAFQPQLGGFVDAVQTRLSRFDLARCKR